MDVRLVTELERGRVLERSPALDLLVEMVVMVASVFVMIFFVVDAPLSRVITTFVVDSVRVVLDSREKTLSYMVS